MNYAKITRKTMTSLMASGALALCCAGYVAAQQASTSYKDANHDPFVKPKPVVRHKDVKRVPVTVAPPAIETRIQQYKAAKLRAMNAQQPAPKPTTALLLSEFEIIGIFRTPRGYAAMVEATPIHLSYVIYPGESFYDGQLVAIEEHRLVFRHEKRWSDGRREMAVEMKPLRQPNVVDPMTSAATKVTASTAPADAEPVKDKGVKPLATANPDSPADHQ